MADQQAELDAAIEDLKSTVVSELAEIKKIVDGIQPGKPLDLTKLNTLKSDIAKMSEALAPSTPPDPSEQNGVVGFTATGNATVSAKFECKNDSVEQMAFLGSLLDTFNTAASAQAPGGAPIEGKSFGNINGVPNNTPFDNLHQLLKGEQAVLKAALAAVDAQCAAEGI